MNDKEIIMKGAVIFGPRDIRYVEREDPRILEPTDAVIRMSATCVCGSDLWPYRQAIKFSSFHSRLSVCPVENPSAA